MDPQILLLSIFTAFSVGLGTWALASINAEAVAGAEAREEFFAENAFFKALLPYIQAISRWVEGIKGFDKMRDDIDRKLLAAGKRDTITPDEFIATQLIGAMIGLA